MLISCCHGNTCRCDWIFLMTNLNTTFNHLLGKQRPSTVQIAYLALQHLVFA
ncbi:hypothetical protein NC652_016217 [Populus alba x Populus x berolinensis]|nr:hypothetical protein NC652_016217 [Populus alba x Populus x berolinensis]